MENKSNETVNQFVRNKYSHGFSELKNNNYNNTIKMLKGANFQMKSATKLMEALDVCDESTEPVWNKDMKTIEMAVLSNGDEYDILLNNTEKDGVMVTVFYGGYGMFKHYQVALHGRSMVAALDSEKRIHLFAIRNNEVWHVEEKTPHSGKFSEAVSIFFVRPRNFTSIKKLLVHRLEDSQSFVLGVVSETIDMKMFWISYQEWGKHGVCRLIPSAFSSSMLEFSGSTMEDLTVECVSTTYTSYSVSGNQNRYSYRLNLPDIGDNVTQLFVPATDTVFLFLQGTMGNLPVEVCIDKQLGVANVCELTDRSNYTAATLYEDGNGGLSMAFSGSRLNYINLTKGPSGYTADEPTPLDYENSCPMFNQNHKCRRLYYLLKEDREVHVLENQGNVTWVENTLLLPKKGEIRRMSCYSTELTFTRADNRLVPLSDVEVTLWAEARTYIETVDGILKLDTDIEAKVQTNEQGKIVFRQYCKGLDVPVIYACLPADFHAEDEAITISQFAGVHGQLSGITSQELLDARQTDSMKGTILPFLPDKYRNEETTDSLAKGIQDTMKIKPSVEEIRLMKRAQLKSVSAVFTANDLPAWSLSFENGHPLYTRLTEEEAEWEINRIKQHCGDKKLPKWLSDIANFFRSVAKGIVSVVKFIVKGLTTVVHFLLDGIEMIFEAVIKVVQEVFHLIESIFAALVIFFLTVFAWLASLFVWDDVMRTKRAIQESMSVILELLPRQIEKVKSVCLEQIKSMDEKIDDCFDTLITQFGAKETFGSYMNQNVPEEDPGTAYELSNNPLMMKFNAVAFPNSYAKQPQAVWEIQAVRTDPFDDLFNLVSQLLEKMSDNPDFKEARTYFEHAMSDMDNFLSSVLCGMLSVIKGIIHAVLNGIGTLISFAMDFFKDIMDKVSQIFTEKMNIPFFSSLYKSMTGDELTLMNLFSFLLGLPVVLVYKATWGDVPFRDDGEVEEFIQRIRSTLGESDSPFTLSASDSAFLKSASMLSAGLLGLCNGIISFTTEIPENHDAIPLDRTFDWIAVLSELAWMVLSIPKFYEKNPSSYAWVAWGWFAVGASVDAGLTFKNHHYIDRFKLGQAFTFFYGIAHMGVAIVGVTCDKEKNEGKEVNGEKELSTFGFAGELIGSITELCKILLLMPKKSTRMIVGAIDLLGSVAIPVCIAES